MTAATFEVEETVAPAKHASGRSRLAKVAPEHGSYAEALAQPGLESVVDGAGQRDEAADDETDELAKLYRRDRRWHSLYAHGINWRQTVFLLLDEPESSVLATVISGGVLVLIIVSTITFVAETTPYVRDDPDMHALIQLLEVACITVFTTEYLTRVATCSQRPRKNRSVIKYMRNPSNLIDLVSILPFYLELLLHAAGSKMAVVRVLRMMRVFRVLKVGHFADDLQLFAEGAKRSGQGLMVLLFLLLLYLCLAGSILYMIEHDAQIEYAEGKYDCTKYACPGERGFSSIPATWYFIIASTTTVGYGDMYPVTNFGRIVCGVCMLTGIFVLGLPIVIIGHSFEEVFAEEKELKAKRKAVLEEKRSHNRRGSPRAAESSMADKAASAAAQMSTWDDELVADFTTENPLRVEPAAALPAQRAMTDASAVLAGDAEFSNEDAILSLCEVLDDLFVQTSDKRYRDAWQVLSKPKV
jgi:hypothetical protein